MHSYRVVCCHNPQKDKSTITVDFAIADANNAELTHEQLFRLRKYEDPQVEKLLPPIMLYEQTDNISVVFEKPQKATPEQNEKLNKLTVLIKCEFNKFKHRGCESSLKITDYNIAQVYCDINPYQSPRNSKEADLFKRIIRSIRIKEQRSKRSSSSKWYLPER